MHNDWAAVEVVNSLACLFVLMPWMMEAQFLMPEPSGAWLALWLFVLFVCVVPVAFVWPSVLGFALRGSDADFPHCRQHGPICATRWMLFEASIGFSGGDVDQ